LYIMVRRDSYGKRSFIGLLEVLTLKMSRS
jgi:hypothetical protein